MRILMRLSWSETEARKSKNWARADEIRDLLAEQGIRSGGYAARHPLETQMRDGIGAEALVVPYARPNRLIC